MSKNHSHTDQMFEAPIEKDKKIERDFDVKQNQNFT